MIVPVRCFSCGKVVGELYEKFREKTKQGATPEKALDDLSVKRYCCRRMIVSQVDLVEEIQQYNA